MCLTGFALLTPMAGSLGEAWRKDYTNLTRGGNMPPIIDTIETCFRCPHCSDILILDIFRGIHVCYNCGYQEGKQS